MRKLFSIFLLGLLFIGCSSDLEEDVTSNGSTGITGSVSDDTTGEPVTTVNVTLSPGGQSTVTGSDGSFSYVNISPGEYIVTLKKEGYKSTSETFYVQSGQQTPAHMLIERIPATISPDRDVLDFGENVGVTTLSFAIVNADYSDLEWVIEYNCDWVKEIKPAMGTLKSGKTETIVVVIDRGKLNSGNNETVLVVKTSNGRSEITVKATGECLPSLNTLEATDVKTTSAVLNGEIIHKGVPEYTERGFVYSTESMPTIETALSKLTVPVSSTNEYSYKLENLTMDNTYYVRAYAINSLGTVYSTNEINFTTHAVLPQVTTEGATDIRYYRATLHGTIVDAGDPPYTERGFVYSSYHSPTINDSKIVVKGSGVGKFSVTESLSLTTGDVYYIRAYATVKGTGEIVYGNEISTDWTDLTAIGLAVQRYTLGVYDWSTASSMCKSSTMGGYTDWRLPTKEELMSIYTNRDAVQFFHGDSNMGYWSSSKAQNTSYYQIFNDGTLDYTDMSRSGYVVAVRTLTN